jgi:hypothetical protein
VAPNLVREQPSRRHRVPVACADDADLALRHDQRRLIRDAKEVGVDAVLARRQDVDLRALLAAVAEKRLAILEHVVRVDVTAEDVARIERPAVDRLDQPDLVLGDRDHVGLLHAVDERRQEGQARLQHPRLHADLVAHRDDALLRQSPSEIAPLDNADLLAADVHEHPAEDDEEHEQEQRDDDDDEYRHSHGLRPFVFVPVRGACVGCDDTTDVR